MLNPFPDILAFGLLSPFIIRLIVGFIFLQFGFSKLTKERAKKTEFFEKLGLRPGLYYTLFIGVIELAVGALFIAGLFTQITAIAGLIISLIAFLLSKKYPSDFQNNSKFFSILFLLSLSLLFSGAGFFAFDSRL